MARSTVGRAKVTIIITLGVYLDSHTTGKTNGAQGTHGSSIEVAYSG